VANKPKETLWSTRNFCVWTPTTIPKQKTSLRVGWGTLVLCKAKPKSEGTKSLPPAY
jgi:hypothetical protein